MVTRRSFMLASSGAVLAGPAAWADALKLDGTLPSGVRENATLEALPGKKPLIRLSYRPPNYETPLSYFTETHTPNDAFFVRYHLADIPEVDADTWRLAIEGGGAGKPYELTLEALKRDFAPVELSAVCQCSGNRRGLFEPHVPGVEWGYGAMGNALWKGVRLKDVLERAGIAKETVEVAFRGADKPVLEQTPAFVKSLPLAKALDPDTLIAYEMNGAPLPHFNGFPVRLIVPGWTATYWMKHLTRLELRTKPEDNFWMKSAYRIPTGKFPIVQRFLSQETAVNTPITEMVVNSVIAAPAAGTSVTKGRSMTVKGVAWDAGYGITGVEVSTDDGQTWSQATLGADSGRYSFRPWSFAFTPEKAGKLALRARASNAIGQSQTVALVQNPAGYHHNVMQRVEISVA